MLGTRTKHVVAYGRRGHRIVNVDDHENNVPVQKKSIFTGQEDPWKTMVLKTKMAQHFPSESPSPQIRRTHLRNSKPKRPLLSLSPTSLKKKRARGRRLIESDILSKSKLDATPVRQPLSAYHPNVPGTPAPLKGKKKAHVAGAMGTPLGTKAGKPFSPFMDMDIIMLDEKGRRVSQERRISKVDVIVNPVGKKDSAKVGMKKSEVIVVSDSDAEEFAPKPLKRLANRRHAVVVSSDDSDIEEIPPPPKLKEKSIKVAQSLVVEVVIPIAKHVTKAHVVAAQPIALPPAPPSPTYVPLALLHAPRARPLTPIRRGASRSLFREPSPPSPTTPTDLDSSLNFDFENISIASSPAGHYIRAPTHLIPLLNECSQEAPHEFSAFIETFPFDPIVQPLDEDVIAPTDIVFRKIGEASYSEVFGIGNVVLKVIPLRDETLASDLSSTSTPDVETPFPSDAKDVLNEMVVTRAVGEVCNGFVKLLRTYIVRGRYPEILLSLWDEYDQRKGSESIRPDGFNVSQVYAIIVLPNGGPDLEAYTFASSNKRGWRQASSVFWQIARTLGQAEELVEFEHRDLHWGQILVRNTNSISKPLVRGQGTLRIAMNDPSHGVEATIIDLGLARMNGGEGVHWTPFDQEIFEGEGDYQFDVYRMMKDSIGEGFKPITNVMWLHYLALKLLHSKRLKAPAVSRKSAVTTPPLFTERECYDSLVEIEGVLAKCIKQATKRKGKKMAKVAADAHLNSAEEVFKYGTDKGWVRI